MFLDVTKAYDKAWLDAIMYVMNKEGLQDNNWTIKKKINENLTARINTKFGEKKTQKNKNKRQHKTGRSPLSSTIGPPHG